MSTTIFDHTETKPAVIDTIYKRRAVRKYKDEPVDKSIIEQIIDAGRVAPSAMNVQPWKFYVLTNAENIKTFSKEITKVAEKDFLQSGVKQIIKMGAQLLLHPDFFTTKDPVFHHAPVVIFITAPRDNEWAALDIGMCTQNMMLAATSMGLDSCPVGFGKYVEHAKSYSRLRIPLSEQVHLALILGYGSESPEPHQRKTDNLFFID